MVICANFDFRNYHKSTKYNTIPKKLAKSQTREYTNLVGSTMDKAGCRKTGGGISPVFGELRFHIV